MNLLFAVLGGAVAGAGVWAAKRFSAGTEGQTARRLLWAAAVALGAFGGYAIPQRTDFWPDMVRLLCVLALLACAARCDLNNKRIPNFFPLALLGVYAVGAAANVIAFGSEGWALVGGGLLSGGIMFAVLMLCRFFSRGGVGYGDIKLVTALSAVLGLYGIIGTLLPAQLAALAAAVVLMILHKAGPKDSLPFAPFLYVGFVISLWLNVS